jgi:hypothetical protein
MTHNSYPSIQEAEIGGSEFWGQSGLYSKTLSQKDSKNPTGVAQIKKNSNYIHQYNGFLWSW